MRIFIFLLCCAISSQGFSQDINNEVFDPNSDRLFVCLDHNHHTAMPFLGFGRNCFEEIMNQIRVVAPTRNGIVNSDQNPALLHQPSAYQAVNVEYTPWQSQFSSTNTHAFKASIQKQFRKGGSWGLRFESFSLLSNLFQSKDVSAFVPQRQLIRLAYAQPISTHWVIGLAAKWANQRPVDYTFFQPIQPAQAIAADLGFTYQNSKMLSESQKLNWQWGFSLTNLGPKVKSELNSGTKLPLPTALSIGIQLEQEMLLQNTSSLRIRGSYQFNKLLVPSPCSPCDENNNFIPDYKEHSALGGMLVSFSDAPGGLKEELKEIKHQLDMSATYKFNEKMGLRGKLMLFYQHPDQGNLQYIGTQLGWQWGRFQMDISYWIPNSASQYGLGLSLGYQHFLDPT